MLPPLPCPGVRYAGYCCLEIFPNAIRGKALAIAVAAQWLANYFVSWTFPMMDKNSWLVAHFHNGFSYWIYGCMGVLAALFMWKFVPETKGKTLEELEALSGTGKRKHNKLLRCNLPVQHAAPFSAC